MGNEAESDHRAPTLAALVQGQHSCLLYEDRVAALQAVAPFVRAGLAANERCVFVVGELELEQVRSVLAAHGVDVALAEERSALAFVTEWEVSFPDGQFDPVAMIAYVRAAIRDAVGRGFRGLRVIAEMTWALRLGVGQNKLIHYEALGNHLYPAEPLVAVCMYDRSRFPGPVCQDALRVHPWVSTTGEVMENLYYERPEMVLEDEAASTRVSWMLQQLDKLRAAERTRQELLEARAARQAAEAAAQARDELLTLLAHELRTPLTGTLLQSQGALRRLRQGVAEAPTQVQRALELVERLTRKQAQLVEHVLAAARATTGQLEVDPAELDLHVLLAEVVDHFQQLYPARRFRLEAPSEVTVRADPVRIEQVVVNLLDNAVKYSPDHSPIDVGLHAPEAGRVELSVRDRGSGVPERSRPLIFDRYYRAQVGHGGLGLGLYLCREIVERHGGEITLECPPDGGARFCVWLPTSASDSRAGEPNIRVAERT